MSQNKDVLTKADTIRLKKALRHTLSDTLETHLETTPFRHLEDNELTILHAMLFDPEIRAKIYAMPQTSSGQNVPRILYDLLSYLLTKISLVQIFDWRYVFIFDNVIKHTIHLAQPHDFLLDRSYYYVTDNVNFNTQLFGNEISRSSKLLILSLLRDLQPLLTNSENLLEETISLISRNFPSLTNKTRQHSSTMKEMLFLTLLETPAIAHLCSFLSVYDGQLPVPFHLSPFFVESLKASILPRGRMCTTNKKQGAVATIFRVSRENKSYLFATNKVKLKVTPLKPIPFNRFAFAQATQSHLSRYGSFLQHDPTTHVIGRSHEISKLLRILARDKKSSPILIGEKGIGKFTLLNNLLLLLGRTPGNPKMFLLDLDKVQQDVSRFIAHLKANTRPLILVITDVPALVNSEVVATPLKIIMQINSVRLIGLTTPPEYKKSLEKTKDWLTLVQPVHIAELSPKNLLEVIRTKKITYERYYQLELHDKLLPTLITLSKHLSTSALPQKALEILDEACSEFKLRSYKNSRKSETLNLSFPLLETYKYNIRLALSEFEKINHYPVQSIFQWSKPNISAPKLSCQLYRPGKSQMLSKDFYTSWQSYGSSFQARVRSLFSKLRRQRYFLDWYKNKWQFTTYVSEYRNRRLTKSYFHLYFMPASNRQKKNRLLKEITYAELIQLPNPSIQKYKSMTGNERKKLLVKELIAYKQRICQHRLVAMVNIYQQYLIIYILSLRDTSFHSTDDLEIKFDLDAYKFYQTKFLNLGFLYSFFGDSQFTKLRGVEKITYSGKFTERYACCVRYLPIVTETLSASVPSSYRNQRLVTPTNNNLLTEDCLIETISKLSGRNLAKLSKTETDKLANLEGRLQTKVIGQYEAIEAVANSLRRASVGLKDSRRPIASFVFAGPSGTGKTELTKALAEIYFGSEESLIRFDMSEYMESHAVSKLIGSPPGYVGYEQGGLLTDQVRKNPFSLVLFDELEKAHPDIFNILLQVLDDGRLTDSQGTVVDFSNTLIIMTSNVGARKILKEAGKASTDEEPKLGIIPSQQLPLAPVQFQEKTSPDKYISRISDAYTIDVFKNILFSEALENRGVELDLLSDSFNDKVREQQNVNKLHGSSTPYEIMKDAVLSELGTIFRPELLNRLDETIVFRKLTKRETRKITEIFLKDVAKRLKKSKNIELIFTKRLKSFLLDVGHDPKYGARPMRRAITRYVEDPLAEKLLEQTILPNTIISVDIISTDKQDQTPKKAYKKPMILTTVLERRK